MRMAFRVSIVASMTLASLLVSTPKVWAQG